MPPVAPAQPSLGTVRDVVNVADTVVVVLKGVLD